MNDGELLAWHYATRQPVRVRWAGGNFTAVEAATETPPRDLWIAPPLVDLQINGYAGVDFQQDNLTLDDLVRAARHLRAAGCARFLFTLITDEWPKMMMRLGRARELRSQSAELQRAIAGWHIEGPFLCAEPGFSGAHNATVMCDPTREHIHELRCVTVADPVLLTVSPERDNAIAAISLAASLGFKVSLGHTDAPSKRLTQAMKAGATGFTHLGNGCPRLLDRHDNILWRMFEMPGLKVSVIPDGIHVSPALFRLIQRTLGPDAIYYTTDAMAAAGAPPGRYKIGHLDVDVGEDRIVRRPGSALFAGSAMEPVDGVFRAAEMLRCGWQDTWGRWSDAPARLMEFSTGLKAGESADFCALQVTPENRLEELRVYVRGEPTP